MLVAFALAMSLIVVPEISGNEVSAATITSSLEPNSPANPYTGTFVGTVTLSGDHAAYFFSGASIMNIDAVGNDIVFIGGTNYISTIEDVADLTVKKGATLDLNDVVFSTDVDYRHPVFYNEGTVQSSSNNLTIHNKCLKGNIGCETAVVNMGTMCGYVGDSDTANETYIIDYDIADSDTNVEALGDGAYTLSDYDGAVITSSDNRPAVRFSQANYLDKSFYPVILKDFKGDIEFENCHFGNPACFIVVGDSDVSFYDNGGSGLEEVQISNYSHVTDPVAKNIINEYGAIMEGRGDTSLQTSMLNRGLWTSESNVFPIYDLFNSGVMTIDNIVSGTAYTFKNYGTAITESDSALPSHHLINRIYPNTALTPIVGSTKAGLTIAQAGTYYIDPNFTVEGSNGISAGDYADTSTFVVGGKNYKAVTYKQGNGSKSPCLDGMMYNHEYSQSIATAYNGSGSYEYYLAPGKTLPNGISLTKAGLVSGKPTKVSTNNNEETLFIAKDTITQVVSAARCKDVVYPDYPSEPRNVKAESGSDCVILTWDVPAYNGYDPGSGYSSGYRYEIYYSTNKDDFADQQTMYDNTENIDLDGDYRDCTVSGLAPDTEYYFVVKATSRGIRYTSSQNINYISARTYSPISYSGQNLTTGTFGTAYSQNIATATGGGGTTRYSLAGGALPAGLSLSSNGVISGTPSAAGSFEFTVEASNFGGEETAKFTMTVNATVAGKPTITEAKRSGDGKVTVKWNAPSSNGGSDITRYRVSWTADGATSSKDVTGATEAEITGLENKKSYEFKVSAYNSIGWSNESDPATAAAYSDLTYTGKALHSIAYNNTYSDTVALAEGGLGSYTYSLESGTLPTGLSLAADGTISGTATTPERKTFTVKVTDSSGLTATAVFTITIYTDLQFSGGGTGSKDDPYLLSCDEDLVKLADVCTNTNNYKDNYFKMTTSLRTPFRDTWNGIEFFAGHFDGGGHELFLETDGGVEGAIFKYPEEGAEIYNLRFRADIGWTNAPNGGLIFGTKDGAMINIHDVIFNGYEYDSDCSPAFYGYMPSFGTPTTVNLSRVNYDIFETGWESLMFSNYLTGGSHRVNLSNMFTTSDNAWRDSFGSVSGNGNIVFTYDNVYDAGGSLSMNGITHTTQSAMKSADFIDKLGGAEYWDVDAEGYPIPKLALEETKITANETYNMTYGGVPIKVSAQADSGAQVRYASGDSSVASIDNSGTVTANKAGQTEITVSVPATKEHRSASKKVTLNIAKAQDIVTANQEVYEKTYGDEPFEIPASATSQQDLIYESSNTDIATVDQDGFVTINKSGSVTITITSPESENYLSGIKTVTVNIGLAEATVESESTYIPVDFGAEPFPIGIKTNSDGELKYTVNDPSIAAVDQNGMVTLLGVGDAIISARVNETEKYKAAELSKDAYVTIHVRAIKPSAPEFEAASGENGQVTITWGEPFLGGANLDEFYIQRSESEGDWSNPTEYTARSMSRQFIDREVENGKTYYYRMYTKTTFGTSDPSEVKSATPYTVPSQPQNLTQVSATNESVRISWTSPSYDGGNAVSGYKLTVADSNGEDITESVSIGEVSADESGVYSCSVEGLSVNTRYIFKVYAINAAVSEENPSEGGEITVSTWTTPGAPTAVRAEIIDKNSVSLSWDEPAENGGARVESYIVQHRVKPTNADGPDTEWTEQRGVLDRSYIVNGLEPGVEYEFRVIAVNASSADGGDKSDVITAIPAQAPQQPTLFNVTNANSGVVIELAYCDDNCGSAVNGYKVYYRVHSDGEEQEEYKLLSQFDSAEDGTLRNARVIGLTNGISYDIAVAAVNSRGDSVLSEPWVITSGRPSKPENVKAVSHGLDVNISFDPAEGNGSNVSGYDVFFYIGKNKPVDEREYDKVTINDTKTTISADKHLNGDVVSVYVVAYNAYGASVKSDMVETSIGAPYAPEITELITSENGINLKWIEKDDNYLNGNAFETYVVYISDDAGNTQSFRTEGTSLEITNEMFDFKPAVRYSATVTCVNKAGESSPSNVKTFMFGTPEVPEVEEPVMGDKEITVKWSSPTSDGGKAIKGYNIYLNNQKNPAVYVDWDEVPPETEDGQVTYDIYVTDYRSGNPRKKYKEQDNLDRFEIVIGGLANGSEYSVNVTAVNENGEGPSKDFENNTVTPATSASEPTNITANAVVVEGNPAGTTASIAWNKPYSDGGTAIDKYKVDVYRIGEKDIDTGEYISVEPAKDENGNETADYSALVDPIDGTEIIADNLKAGSKYRAEIRAITKAAEPGAAGIVEFTTHSAPGRPTVTALESGLGSDVSLPLTVKWAAPKDNGGTEITGYDICVVTSTGTFSLNKERISADARECTISNDIRLKNKRTLRIAVIAYNAVGSTIAKDKTIRMGTIKPPQNITATGDMNGSIAVTWPLDQYSDILDSIGAFSVYLGIIDESGNFVVDSSASCTVEELQNDGAVMFDFVDIGVEKAITVAVSNKEPAEGSMSEPIFVTIGAPEKVDGVTAEAKENAALVRWNAVDGSTGYKVYVDGELKETVSADLAEALVTGLKAETQYSITVRAINNNGISGGELIGTPSDAVTVVPYAKPDKPNVSNIRPGLGEFSFEFNTPNGNGADINGYKVYVDGEEVSAAITNGEPNTAVVRGITDGVNHEFYIIAASNVNLQSDPPEQAYIVKTGVPAPPEVIKVKADRDGAELTFRKSEDISAETPTTEYIIYQEADGVKTEITPHVNAGEADPETGMLKRKITGLENGKEYKFTVKAVNATGIGAESGAVTVKTGTPNAPEITNIVSGNGSLTVNWTKPEANVGSVTRYTIYLNNAEAVMADGGATSATITGLRNGVSYVVNVSASNLDYGEGALSDAKIGMPGTISEAVTEIKSTAGYDNGCNVLIEWEEPADNGGLAIEKYIVSGEGISDEQIHEVDESGSPIETESKKYINRKALISGLDEDSAYVIYIKAVNSAGEGKTGEYAAQTLAKPNAPQLLGVDTGNRVLVVNWSAPTSNADGILYYTIEAKPVNDAGKPIDGGKVITVNTEENPIPDENGQFFVRIGQEDGLVVGTKYQISVKAVNAVGEGPESNSTRITVTNDIKETPPGAPQNFKATAGDTKVDLSWSVPADNGNSTITSYVIYYGTEPDNMSRLDIVDAYTFTYAHTGLKNDITYYYKIKAVNGVSAEGGDFTDTAAATPSNIEAPSAPQWPDLDNVNGVSAYETNAIGDAMTITWNESIDPAGNTPITYTVHVNNITAQTTETSYVIENPTESTQYNIWVEATNSRGVTSSSEFIRAHKNLNVRKGSADEGYDDYPDQYANGIYAWIDKDYDGKEDTVVVKPSAPQNFDVQIISDEQDGNMRAILTWSAPESNGNARIVKYNVYANEDKKEVSAETVTYAMNRSSEEFEFDYDIEYGKAYTFYVTAVNSQNIEGDMTAPKMVFKMTPPTGLEAVKNADNVAAIDLSWNEISGAGGYVLYANGKAEVLSEAVDGQGGYTVTDGVVKYTFTGEIGKQYSFSVATMVNDNISLPCEPISADTYETPPGTPINVSVNPNSEKTQLIVTWGEPDAVEGTEIGGYVIRVNGIMLNDASDSSSLITNTEYPLDGCMNSFVEVAAVSTNGTVGEFAQGWYFINSEQEYDTTTPPMPTDLVKEYAENTAEGILPTENNLKLSWTAGTPDDNHTGETASYDVYVNAQLAASDLTATECTVTIKPGTLCTIDIVPKDADGKEGPPLEERFKTLENTYAKPEVTDFKAELSTDKAKITLTWTEAEGIKYILTANGDVIESARSGYEYPVPSGVINNIFNLRAVKTYEDGHVEEAEANKQINISDDSGSGEYMSNPAVITGYISTGKTASDGKYYAKVLWTAPEPIEGEKGTITEYRVVEVTETGETVLGTVAADTNPLAFEIPFDKLTDRKTIKVKAYKEAVGDAPVSTSTDASITPFCNNVEPGDYESGNIPQNPTNPDKDMNGTIDDAAENVVIKGSVSEEGIKVTLIDEFSNRIDGTVEKGEKTGGYTAFTASFPSSSIQGSVYSVEISKDVFTKYTLKGVPKDKLAEVVLNNVTIYAGDMDENGRINSNDKFILQGNINKNPAEVKGDLDENGRINANDKYILLGNINKSSVTETWSN